MQVAGRQPKEVCRKTSAGQQNQHYAHMLCYSQEGLDCRQVLRIGRPRNTMLRIKLFYCLYKRHSSRSTKAKLDRLHRNPFTWPLAPANHCLPFSDSSGETSVALNVTGCHPVAIICAGAANATGTVTPLPALGAT